MRLRLLLLCYFFNFPLADPASRPSTPSAEHILLVSDGGSPGLFGPRSPRPWDDEGIQKTERDESPRGPRGPEDGSTRGRVSPGMFGPSSPRGLEKGDASGDIDYSNHTWFQD